MILDVSIGYIEHHEPSFLHPRWNNPVMVAGNDQTAARITAAERWLNSFAWVGDGNNVLASWVHASARMKFRLSIATPPELAPSADLVKWAKANGADVAISTDAGEAVKDADCVVADTFVSMGDDEAERRHNLLMPYQVNARLMANTKPDAIFMHCLPAHRGEEVTADVIDGPQSVVFDEAENRLHAQKAVLVWCLK